MSAPSHTMRKLLLRSCFTSLINVRSPCLLVDLGRPVHGLFSIFSHWSNLLKKFRHCRSKKKFPIWVFFNPSWCRCNNLSWVVTVYLLCVSSHVGNSICFSVYILCTHTEITSPTHHWFFLLEITVVKKMNNLNVCSVHSYLYPRSRFKQEWYLLETTKARSE